MMCVTPQYCTYFGYLSYDITVTSIANIAQFRLAKQDVLLGGGANLLEIPIGFCTTMCHDVHVNINMPS